MISFSQLGSYGRMCNAFFEIAAAVALARRNNDNPIFPHWKYEKCFNLPSEWFADNINYIRTYQEPFFHYKEIPYSPIMNISGYYQSIRYWEDYQEYIRQIFSPAPQYKCDKLNGITAIHVRRTDYLQFSDCHTVLGMDYYNRAMELCPSQKYLVFSDDINWCKQNFRGNQFDFSEGNDEVKDLFMMAACENQIIANSSYSWWGAWLNNNTNKIVIAPKNWFGPKLKHDTKDLLLKEWKII